MKVKELIKKLEEFDPEEDVYAWNCGCGGCGMYDYDVESVKQKYNYYDKDKKDGVILNMGD